jgi:hypothetical protein
MCHRRNGPERITAMNGRNPCLGVSGNPARKLHLEPESALNDVGIGTSHAKGKFQVVDGGYISPKPSLLHEITP